MMFLLRFLKDSRVVAKYHKVYRLEFLFCNCILRDIFVNVLYIIVQKRFS